MEMVDAKVAVSSPELLAQYRVDFGFQRSRKINVWTDHVELQLTLSCGHCNTCRRRYSQITSSLRTNGISFKVSSDEQGRQFASFSLPEGRDAIEYVASVCGLNAYWAECVWVRGGKKIEIVPILAIGVVVLTAAACAISLMLS